MPFSIVLLLFGLMAALGIGLLAFARLLSERYNAWTTKMRSRHEALPPPPTDAMRVTNTRIMTVIFRVLGLILMLPACF